MARPVTIPLLHTKLSIPATRPSLVPRPRLIRQLDDGLRLGHRLILVSAPAGYGKTTLLAEWLAAGEPSRPTADRPMVAWLSLDQDDNDPVRFVAYLVTALQKAANVGDADLFDVADLRYPLSINDVLAALINRLEANSNYLVLVLDDYHEMTAPTIHEVVIYILEHLPAKMHLVLASRTDPPLPLARLRGRGQLTELRQTDLRFNHAEAIAFLNQAMGLALSTTSVATLTSRTEGWVAGLQLAAVSLQRQQPGDKAAFIDELSGSNRYILDYLIDEVLQQQPSPVQQFLMRTAILDRLCGPLCDAVLGKDERGSDSARLLEELERNNLFIVALDEARVWYRYHQLFADLLRQRLQRSEPDLPPILHRRAGAWLHQHGFTAEAIEHSLAAQDYPTAADLLRQVAGAMFMRSELATIRRWAAALPTDLLCTHPLLMLYYAGMQLLDGQSIEVVEASIAGAVAADTLGETTGWVKLLRSLIATYQGNLTRSTELARQGLKELSQAGGDFLGLDTLLRNAGYILDGIVNGKLEPAISVLREMVQIGRLTDNTLLTVLVYGRLTELLMLAGRLAEAHTLYRQAQAHARDPQGQLRPVGGMALIGLSSLLYEWNELDQAESLLHEGIALMTQMGEIASFRGHIELVRVKLAQGNIADAQSAVECAQKMAERFDVSGYDDAIAGIRQAHIWLAQQDARQLRQWVEDHKLPPAYIAQIAADPSALPLLRAYECSILARHHLKFGAPAQALEIVDWLLPPMEQAGWSALVIEALALRALALDALDRPDEADATLLHALTLAEPEGYIRTFVDAGPGIGRLLYRVAAQGQRTAYASRLLVAIPDAPPVSPVTAAAPAAQPGTTNSRHQPEVADLVEPLSEREIDVLSLISDGSSNQEIAQCLYLSLSTVKWHTGNIYGKLNVKNRTEAVAKARALGILPRA